MKITAVAKAATLATLAVAGGLGAVRADEEDAAPVFSVPESKGHAFLETFQSDPFDGEGQQWIESKDSSYEGQKWSHGPRTKSSDFYQPDLVSNNSVYKPPSPPSSCPGLFVLPCPCLLEHSSHASETGTAVLVVPDLIAHFHEPAPRRNPGAS